MQHDDTFNWYHMSPNTSISLITAQASDDEQKRQHSRLYIASQKINSDNKIAVKFLDLLFYKFYRNILYIYVFTEYFLKIHL